MNESSSGMTASNRLLIHTGYHKTGSTWFQQVLLAAGETGFTLPWTRAQVNDELVLPKQLLFEPASAAKFFEKGLAEAGSAARIPVISNERLSGNPHSGGWDAKLIADRLFQVFPEAHVLMVIREQRSVIRSMYFQYVREGGPASLRHYLESPKAGKYRVPLFDLDFYAYHRLIEYYRDLFGREGVLVLPYELLRENPDETTRLVCDFAGATVPTQLPKAHRNPSLTAFSVALMRHLNRLFVRDSLNPAAPLPIPRATLYIRRAFLALDRFVPGPLIASFEQRVRAGVAVVVDSAIWY